MNDSLLDKILNTGLSVYGAVRGPQPQTTVATPATPTPMASGQPTWLVPVLIVGAVIVAVVFFLRGK